MSKKILRFLRTDLLWILLALGLSVFLWLVSMTLLDPEQNEPYWQSLVLDNLTVLDTERVVLLNMEELLAENILVGVRAPASLHGLDAELEIRASIDFRAIRGEMVHDADGPVAISLPVSVNLPPGFVLHHISPPEVVVNLDAFVQQQFSIEMDEIGTIAAGYELREIWTAITAVTLSGPRSYVNRVARVQVDVELTGMTESDMRTMRLTARDAHLNDISHLVGFNITETPLGIDILPTVRVPIIPHITGEMAEGFAVAAYEVYPAEVTIVGTADRLANITEITPVFDLEQASTAFERVFAIAEWLPEGVELARGAIGGAHFMVNVEPIEERAFDIPRDNIGVFGFAQYGLVDDPTHVTVRVSGPASLIHELDVSEIIVQLNLVGREVGTHIIPLQIILPAGLQLVGAAPSLEVRIDDPDAGNANNTQNDPPYDPAPPEPPTPDPPYDPTPPEPPTPDPPYDPAPPDDPYPPDYSNSNDDPPSDYNDSEDTYSDAEGDSSSSDG